MNFWWQPEPPVWSAPLGALSIRSASVSASTPAFAVVYGPISGAWAMAAKEEMFSR